MLSAIRSFVLRAMRLSIKLASSALALIGFGKKSVKSSTEFLSGAVWVRLYEIWDRNKARFIAQAPSRECPMCGASQAEPLWSTEDGYQYLLCGACRMVYSSPALLYDQWRAYSRELAAELDPVNNALVDAKLSSASLLDDRRRFSDYLSIISRKAPGKRVLDVGSFTGNFLSVARDHGFDPTGIEFYSVAAERGSTAHKVKIRQGFFEELAPGLVEAGEKYDLITLWETFEHMLYPDAVLKYCHQLLSDKGLVAITVPNFDCLHVRLLREKCYHCLGGPGNPGHMNMFTESTLKTICKKNGFRVEHFETQAGTDYADVLNYLAMDFQRISSYSNSIRPRSEPTLPLDTPFLSAPIAHLVLSLSPIWRLVENAFNKGALLFLVARKEH